MLSRDTRNEKKLKTIRRAEFALKRDYTRTAAIWTAILGFPVTAKQAALCMCAVKLSREAHKPSRDNLVDLAGYAAVAHRIDERAAGNE